MNYCKYCGRVITQDENGDWVTNPRNIDIYLFYSADPLSNLYFQQHEPVLGVGRA